MREIYFDNAATTRVRPEVARLALKLMEEDYANPSSMHSFGLEAEKYIRNASADIAFTLKVEPEEIVFNSGGTEGNNTALYGIAHRRKKIGRHIISSSIEHASVHNPLKRLKKEGFEVTFLAVDASGHLDPETVALAMRPDTILVSLMWVNNEIGSVLDIPRIARQVKTINPKTYIHTDAVQAYGKISLRPREAQVDVLTVSGHKIHAPKGTGFMYVDSKVLMDPLLLGGGQQQDRRSGTENVPGIAALALASRLYYEEHENIEKNLLDVKKRLIRRLLDIKGVSINSKTGPGWAPHILSVSFGGVRAEVLLHALEEKGIYVSSGSACSSNHPAVSPTLRAIGVKKELLDSTIRFSFGIFNTIEEAEITADTIKEILPKLRRFQRTPA